MTDNNKPVTTRRAGGAWEAVGTLLLIGGLIAFAVGDGKSGWGAAVAGIGLLVFLVGRFL